MKQFVSALLLISTFLNASSLQERQTGLSDSQLDSFVLGKSFFRTPWVEAPSATTARDGLGPLFSANTCISCHPQNARGSVYNAKGEISRSLVTRISVKNSQAIDPKLGFAVEPTYGSQLSINAIYGVTPEGKPSRTYKEKMGLKKPIYAIEKLGYGPLSKDTILSQRVAPALVGLDFLEQISDAQILESEDINDSNSDGISGKANRVYSPLTSQKAIGRYNYKANAPTVKYQVAAAMSNDMGLTSPLFPSESCTTSQKECLESPKGKDAFDVPMQRLDAVTFYLKNLKLPQTKKSYAYRSGLEIFKQIGCVSCHRESFTLESGKKIHPFSDLLLHDMGEGLADGREEFDASGSEFRTTPLWGISVSQRVLKKRMTYLHDGRATTLQEAILWHGGEAERARESFEALSPEKKRVLTEFLESL